MNTPRFSVVMRRRRVLLLATVAALLPWAAPGGAAAAAGADAPVGRLYTPGAFDSLSFAGSASVQFRQGERDEVFIEGDEEVQRGIQLDLRGSELGFRSEGNWRFWSRSQRVKVRITMRELKRLTISGAADFVAAEPVTAQELRIDISGAGAARFERLQAQSLRFTVSGSGDGHFNGGSVEELSVSISGRSEFFGEQLKTRSARLNISGVGKARVWVTGDLNAGVSGIGTIDYWGRPNVNRRTSGVATMNDRGDK